MQVFRAKSEQKDSRNPKNLHKCSHAAGDRPRALGNPKTHARNTALTQSSTQNTACARTAAAHNAAPAQAAPPARRPHTLLRDALLQRPVLRLDHRFELGRVGSELFGDHGVVRSEHAGGEQSRVFGAAD